MKKDIVIHIGVNIAVQIALVISGFILPPLIISTYGSVQNGMVASIGQFISYLALVEAGISSVSIAALARPLYNNDKNQINSILAATRNFYSKAGGIFAVMILALIFIYPNIIADKGIDKITAGLMVAVLSIGTIFDFFVIGKYQALLIADRKFFVMGIFRIITIIINVLVSITLIKNNYSLLFVKFASSLTFTLNYIMIFIYIKTHYNYINLKTKFSKDTLLQKWDMMYHRLAGIVLDNSPLIILTIFCSLKDVSIYSVYAMLFFAVGQFIDSFYDGLQGFFGRFLAEDNPDKLKESFSKYETMYFLIMGIAYTSTFILTIPFMQIYTKNMLDANYIQPLLAMLFVLVGIMNKVRSPATMLFISAGHFKQTKWRAVAEAVINISASVFFTVKFGFIGVLLGTVCSLAYRAPDLIIYSSRHIVHNNLFITLTKIILIGAWYFAGYYLLKNFIIGDIKNYFDFVENAVITVMILAFPAAIYLYFLWKSSRGQSDLSSLC